MVGGTKIIIKRSSRKSLSLRLEPDATLVVHAPLWISEKQVSAFVRDHADWVEKNLAKLKKSSSAQKEGTTPYLGKSLLIFPGNYTTISVKDDRLLFPKSLMFRKEKELTAWYIREAKRIIIAQVEMYAKEMDVVYTSLTFSDTRSQWGRCTHDNRLQFSWRLVMAPMLVLTYVVVHELVHITQKNHTIDFWLRVRKFNPSYRQQVKWLKEHGSTLNVS